MRFPRVVLNAYLVGVLGIIVIAALKFGLSNVASTPFTGLFFTPPILIAATMGGLAPGSFTTALALPFIYYFTILRAERLDWIDVILFSLVGFGIAWLGGMMREAHHRSTLANQQLQKREAYLQSILDSISDATIAIRGNGEIISFNAAAERYFGYREEEILNRNVLMLMPEPYRSQHDGYLKNYQETGSRHVIGVERNVTGKRRDGTIFPMSLRVAELASDDETLFVGFVRDLTERETAVTALEATQAELIRLSRHNELAEMASTLAHELNQPLAAISNYVRGCRRIAQDLQPEMLPQLTTMLEAAGRQALRAGDIVHHLREFMTRGETSKAVVDMSTMVHDAATLGLVGAKELGVTVEITLDGRPAPVLADSVQIQQVIVNLLRNAVDAVRHHDLRHISIVTTIDGDHTLLKIIDSGLGIAPDLEAHMFEPFITSKSTGMGVGLSISKRIIESHDGRIGAETRAEGGAMFWFTLPLILTEGVTDER